MAEPAKAAMKGSGAIRFLDGVDRLVGRICKFTVMTTGVVLLFAIIIGVIARYIIDVGGVDWAEELPKQIFPWFIMAGVVLALQTGNHIAVDLIYNYLNGPSKRVLVVTTNLFLCGAYAYLCLTALDVAEIAALERNPMLGTPNSLPFYALAIGSALTALSALVISVRVLLLGEAYHPHGSAEESVV